MLYIYSELEQHAEFDFTSRLKIKLRMLVLHTAEIIIIYI